MINPTGKIVVPPTINPVITVYIELSNEKCKKIILMVQDEEKGQESEEARVSIFFELIFPAYPFMI